MGSMTVGTERQLGPYMTAVCIEQKARTFVWDVFDRDGGLLGRVSWYPR